MTDKIRVPLLRMFNGNHYVVGASAGDIKGCTQIYLLTDGHGPMGWYDRVHVLFDDDRHLVFPAHHCQEMEFMK